MLLLVTYTHCTFLPEPDFEYLHALAPYQPLSMKVGTHTWWVHRVRVECTLYLLLMSRRSTSLLTQGSICLWLTNCWRSLQWVSGWSCVWSNFYHISHLSSSPQPQCLVTAECYLPSAAHSQKENVCLQPVSSQTGSFTLFLSHPFPSNFLPFPLTCSLFPLPPFYFPGDAILWSNSREDHPYSFEGKVPASAVGS